MMATVAPTVHATQSDQLSQEQRRYRLPDVILLGAPVSTNRAKVKARVGETGVMAFYTPRAQAWMDQARDATLLAIAQRDAMTPHPRDWPRPLQITVWVRDFAIDLDNCLKTPVDGMAPSLGVNDKEYEYGGVRREQYARGQRGLRFIIESAPIGSSGAGQESYLTLETTKPAGQRVSCRNVVRRGRAAVNKPAARPRRKAVTR